jgi:hypothetical protein
MMINLLVALAARQHDLGGIDDDDVVAVVDVRGVRRLVLAAQPHGDNRRQPADHQAGGIDEQPFFVDVSRLGGMRGHRISPCRRWRF